MSRWNVTTSLQDLHKPMNIVYITLCVDSAVRCKDATFREARHSSSVHKQYGKVYSADAEAMGLFDSMPKRKNYLCTCMPHHYHVPSSFTCFRESRRIRPNQSRLLCRSIFFVPTFKILCIPDRRPAPPDFLHMQQQLSCDGQ